MRGQKVSIAELVVGFVVFLEGRGDQMTKDCGN